MKRRKLVFHATSDKNLESILKTGELKPSGGRYGTGVYCRLSFVKSADYNNCVFGIYLRGLEDIAVVPANKIGKWIVFTEPVPLESVKYVVRFNQVEGPYEEIERRYENGIWFYDVPFVNEVDKQEKVVEVSNEIFQHSDKHLKYPPRYNRIRVTPEYSIKEKLNYTLGEVLGENI